VILSTLKIEAGGSLETSMRIYASWHPRGLQYLKLERDAFLATH